jgi:hypothetical protein
MRRLLLVLTAVYTVLLITRPHEFLPSLTESSLLQIILLCGFAVWLFVPDKGIELAQFQAIPFFLFFVWLSLGIGGGWWGGIVPALEKLVPPILLFVILSGSVRSIHELKFYSLIVIACACIIVTHGHFQSTEGIGWTGSEMIEGRITYSGIFNDPNDIGLLIVLSVALVIFQLGVQRGKLMRLVLWSSLGWLLYGIYLTDSRGTMLAVLAVFGLEARRLYGNVVVGIAGTGVIAVLFAYTRLAELDAEEASAGNRVEAWYEGLQMLIQNPGFGVGWGMFSDYNFGLTAHNSLILAMAELGLFGYTMWMALVLLSGLMIYRLAQDPGIRKKMAPEAPTNWLANRTASLSVEQTSALNEQSPVVAAAEIDSKRGAQVVADEQTERLAARALLLAAIGFAVGAFFLSQSFKAMLFINIGLIVGRYLGMREVGIAVPDYGLPGYLPMVFGLTIASVAGMWVFVRILL